MAMTSPVWKLRSPSFCAWKSYRAVQVCGFGPALGRGLSAGGGGGARLPLTEALAAAGDEASPGEYGGGARTRAAPAPPSAAPAAERLELFCREMGGVKRDPAAPPPTLLPDEIDVALLRDGAPPAALLILAWAMIWAVDSPRLVMLRSLS